MGHGEIKKYLPRISDLNDPFIDRKFMVTIINTVEPTYFRDEMKKIEQLREENMLREQQDMIEVKPEILELL